MWAIVGLGLGYMTPMTVFDTFGLVSEATNSVVPLAYLVALVAMVFTAISYGRMTRVYPSAGSAFTYTSEVIHPNAGFLVGWSSLLDYLLLPMVNAVIGRIYFESFFPDAPSWVFVVVYVGVITAFNLWSIKGTSRVNGILVVFQTVLIGVFIVLAWLSLRHGMGAGTALTLDPLYHAGVDMSAVITGATVVCFSFIGFDAITMYSEEAKTPNTVPKAIVLALLIGGAIFFVAAWFSQAVFPNLDGFEVTDDTLPEMALKVGGQFFKILFTSAALAAMVASSLSSHASVSRMVYVMARNGKGRIAKYLAYIHPTFLTPAHAVVIVGVVSLLAIKFTLEFASAMINFGALIAFTFVNLTVLVYFAIRLKQRRTPKEILINIVLPVIGMCMTLVLWSKLHVQALEYGAIWFTIGVILLVYLTRGFRQPMTMKIEEETLAEEGTPVPHVKHGDE
ncbi:APC family permease [Mycolicibacterium brisbanense]|uniref:Amino acid permease-associated protein n=2 Tax=Mycolicibacterium brisbanense TaxID=146020 RepID=A0A100VXV4_9MYCO|nr:APC family permease [Mycolicibacterium brisbanense]GAS88032.1 amino acid permease-associated protein [Mycolicibacterium brisbanense]